MKINEEDIIVRFLNMPTSAREFVRQNEDGTYTIIINSKLSDTMQTEAYKHALEHIEHSDWEKSDVQSIEAHAHHIEPVVVQAEPIKKPTKRRKTKRNQRYEEYARKSILLQQYGYEPEFYSIYDD